MFFIKSKAENQLKFQTAQRVRTSVKLLCREMPDFIIASNLWLLNVSDFSPVDYRILAMLQEWVCQHPMRDVDKLRQTSTDRRSLIKRLIRGDLG